MTPAETLRAAAAALHVAYDDVAAHSDGWAQGWPVITLAQHCNPEVVRFVRAMSPAVALAVADWLEVTADVMTWLGPPKILHTQDGDRLADSEGIPRTEWDAAVIVARSVLGETAHVR